MTKAFSVVGCTERNIEQRVVILNSVPKEVVGIHRRYSISTQVLIVGLIIILDNHRVLVVLVILHADDKTMADVTFDTKL